MTTRESAVNAAGFADISDPFDQASLDRIKASLHLDGAAVNELDFEDLYVSESVLESLRGLAGEALQDAARARKSGSETTLRAFWVEKSRSLILCLKTPGGMRLLQAPEGHWRVKESVTH